MKIIFFGLLIAVLVVFGHGDNSNEPTHVPAISTFGDLNAHLLQSAIDAKAASDASAKKLDDAQVESAKEIEENRKEEEKWAEDISSLRAQLSNPDLPPAYKSIMQRILDVLIERDQKLRDIRDKRNKAIQVIDDDIKKSREKDEEMDKLFNQHVLTVRERINSPIL
ncbi:uncharacterized protein LOC132793502 [Drosophila nasuta]|uniref:uncharacterized protein LOC132793502 n=1 Tax=Drosophila nasuta TaxID=42062 RepID=UPI00295EC9A7|nr:uncharacterized protein LOC132793502 [Drosophila nasuta]